MLRDGEAHHDNMPAYSDTYQYEAHHDNMPAYSDTYQYALT